MKTREGKPVSVEGSKENATNGKQKDSVQKEMLAVSATVRTSVEKGHNRPLLPRNRRLKVTGKILWKGKLPDAAVLLERDIKRMPLDLSDQDYGGRTLKLLLWLDDGSRLWPISDGSTLVFSSDS